MITSRFEEEKGNRDTAVPSALLSNSSPPTSYSTRFRTLPSLGAGLVDDKGTIYNVSLASTGEALGHDLIFDDTSLQQIVEIASRQTRGVKSRYTHPGLSADGLGKYLGRVHNVHLVHNKILGDLHLSALASKSPQGDLGAYILDMARNEPESFGMSLVLDLRRVWLDVLGDEHDADESRPIDATTRHPLARVTAVIACDCVDEPALNPDGLFSIHLSRSNILSEEVYSQLDEFLQHYDVSPQRAYDFALRYLQRRGLQVQQEGVNIMSDESVTLTTNEHISITNGSASNGTLTVQPVQRDWLTAQAAAATQAILAASGLPKPARDRLAAQQWAHPDDLSDAIEGEKEYIAQLSAQQTIHMPKPLGGGRIDMRTGLDEMQSISDWIFGVKASSLPEPRMRRVDDWYRFVTGDLGWQGVFHPEHAFAAASTTTLADLAVNAMNKVLIETYDTLGVYRWFEQVVTVQPNDGTLYDMAWITFGGIANLSRVAEGAAYSEATVGDVRETDAYITNGNYVGITRKMLRNSDIARIQAVPKALMVAAIRTRSNDIAGIFTQASGTGPTLDQDSVVLFHTATHVNLLTTAFSVTSWAAARLECFKGTEITSAKRQGLWPKYWLGPADLYDSALITFGYGAGYSGYPGTGNNDVNPYAESRPGDPRPIPLAVPEFTDATDWAYLADPSLAPILQMSYSQNPGGRTHPMPELFSAPEGTGLLFTNDVLPIKIRDEYAFGVSTYRGIGKRNVA